MHHIYNDTGLDQFQCDPLVSGAWVSTVQGDCCHWFSQVLAINMTALPGVGLILKFSLISETDCVVPLISPWGKGDSLAWLESPGPKSFCL